MQQRRRRQSLLLLWMWMMALTNHFVVRADQVVARSFPVGEPAIEQAKQTIATLHTSCCSSRHARARTAMTHTHTHTRANDDTRPGELGSSLVSVSPGRVRTAFNIFGSERVRITFSAGSRARAREIWSIAPLLLKIVATSGVSSTGGAHMLLIWRATCALVCYLWPQQQQPPPPRIADSWPEILSQQCKASKQAHIAQIVATLILSHERRRRLISCAHYKHTCVCVRALDTKSANIHYYVREKKRRRRQMFAVH